MSNEFHPDGTTGSPWELGVGSWKLSHVLFHRYEPGHHAGRRGREYLTGQLKRDVEQIVGSLDDVVDAAELIEDDFLCRHLAAAHFEAAQLLATERRDEQVVLPARILLAVGERHAARRDGRRVVGDRLFHAHFFTPGDAGLVAHRDDAPAVVLPFADDVDLVAALRSVLGLPELTGDRIPGQALRVPVA